MLAVQLKTTSAMDITKPLRGYIAKEYSEAEADKFQPALVSLAQMRKDVEAVRTPSPMSRMVLLRYHAQLDLLESRFPVGDTQVKLPFTWYDSFCPRQKLTQNSLKFEQDAVMFLVGALESQSAVNCDRSTAEGLKAACNHFMAAAGAFAAIQAARAPGARTVDLSNDGLSMLVNLMLGQAQACFYEKSIKDKMKDGIKSKLATQAVAFYTSALDFANSATLKTTIDRLWAVHIEFQVMCMKAAAQYWQAKASKDAALTKGSGYGEEIARLATADALCAAAINHANEKRLPPSLPASVRQLKAIITDGLANARKDNDTIYMETIPKLADLPVLSAATMVKPQLPEKEKVPDLFDGLVPTWLRQKTADFEATVQSIVTASAAAVAAHNEQARSHLAVLGLPAAVEAFEKGAGLPPSLWKRVEACQANGLTAPIGRILEENGRAKVQVEEQLRHIENLLRDEAQDDLSAKASYGAQWTRAPSAALNAGLYADVDRYHKLLREAAQSDLAITASLNKPELVQLGQTQAELTAKIPERDPTAATVDTSILSNLMVLLGVLLQKRDDMQADLAAEAASSPSLVVLAATSSDDVFAAKLASVEQKRALIDGTFSEQADLLSDISARNDAFKQARQADPVTRQREQALLDLQRAVELYEQLLANATEGGAFYAELAHKLQQLEQTVTDHCAARDLEKRELELNFAHNTTDDGRLAQQLQQSLNVGDDQMATDAALAASLANGAPQTYAPPSPPRAAPPAYPGSYGNHHPANPYPPASAYGQPTYTQQPPAYPGTASPYGQPPQYGQPQYGQPQYGQPQYGQPQYGQPQYGQPSYPGAYPQQQQQYPGGYPPQQQQQFSAYGQQQYQRGPPQQQYPPYGQPPQPGQGRNNYV
ncbi:programmed cell death 6-interacting protein [Achlya hypogyna]|uniref:Programmed cell death 6-interacting protein n=1 Tax=Achlya hypogyna TaxID=1202772 RepID=A0A1V9Z245_ACHHY|nr:programmed cell death 6-interacting protein [Achlya hypogyna]